MIGVLYPIIYDLTLLVDTIQIFISSEKILKKSLIKIVFSLFKEAKPYLNCLGLKVILFNSPSENLFFISIFKFFIN